MIKLEDLKIGEEIFLISEDGSYIYSPLTVKEELFILDVLPEPIESVWCKGGVEFITREKECRVFRTKEEAEKIAYEIRFKKAKELLNSDKFVDRLFECATSSKRLNIYDELPIYKLAIKLYKEKLKEI